jgi:carbamoyltransferase
MRGARVEWCIQKERLTRKKHHWGAVGDFRNGAAHFTESWLGAQATPGDWREVSSFYRADRARVECIGKQVWDGDEARPAGLGMFYFLLRQAMFPGEGNEGKVMGLAPHGDPRALGLPDLDVDGTNVTMPPAWRDILQEKRRFRYASAFRHRSTNAAANQPPRSLRSKRGPAAS